MYRRSVGSASAASLSSDICRHSPSSATQPDSAGMSRDLPLGQGLCECICGHVISGISKCDGSIVDGLPDEMVTDIDMLCAGVIIVINREPDWAAYSIHST